MKLKVVISLLGLLVATFASAERKNVLLICIDDLRPQLGCYGHEEVISPNIDRLASQGVRFDAAYTQQAVCGPSRLTLMTGVRPSGPWELPAKFLKDEWITLPRYFRKNGYTTVSVGKIYHQYNDDPQAWDLGPWNPWKDKKFESWQAYVDPESLRIKAQHRREGGKNGPLFESPEVDDSAYRDGMAADLAIEHLRAVKDQPFFMAVGFVKPHLPFNAPKKYCDLYDPATLPMPKRKELPDNISGFGATPLLVWNEMRQYAGVPETGPVSKALTRQLIHGYLACISQTDAQVGRVIAELERLGLRDKTTVVIWGDHGFKLGDYGAWVKHTNLELDTRIPLIVSAPGRTAPGRGSDGFVETVDVASTLAELSGLEIPAHWEGSSFVPLLNKPDLEWKRAVFSRYHSKDSQGQDAEGSAIRTRDWRYIEWRNRKSGKVLGRDLFDHRKEELESFNLAGDPRYCDIVDELSTLLADGNGWRSVRNALEAEMAK